MNIENLKENDLRQVNNLLESLQQDNKQLSWKTYLMDARQPHEIEQDKLEKKLDLIEKKIDDLKSAIEFIFASNILVNGKFIDYKSIEIAEIEKR